LKAIQVEKIKKKHQNVSLFSLPWSASLPCSFLFL